MTQAANDAARPHNRSPAVEFLAALFNGTSDETDGRVYLSSLPNEQNDPLEPIGEKHVCPPSGEAVDKFIHRYDRPRRGLFVCVGTVADNKRNKDNVRETVCLHCDIDFKGLVEDEPAIRAALATLATPPSLVVRSGNGLHLYWLFREPIETQPHRDRLEAALRKLADACGGDTAVCEVSRLMRLPGTHNSKRGDWREVVIERHEPGIRYELEDLENWLDEQRPVLVRKPIEAAVVQTTAEPVDDNPYLKHAREWGYKPRLDVDAALAAMGEGNIHTTLRDVAASLIRAGQPLEEVVGILMEAARAVGGPEWNWRAEEKKIRDLCTSAQKKFPPKEDVPRETTEDPPSPPGEDPCEQDYSDHQGPPPDDPIDLNEERARRGQAKANPRPRGPKALIAPFVVAEGVIETLRRNGMDIMLAEGEVWFYGNGFWRVMVPADQQWLLTEIQNGFERLGEPGKTSSLTSCWKRINEHPRLFKREVAWANNDLIVCRNGVWWVEGNRFDGHRPENYAKRSIGADFDPSATCKRFEALLWDMLGRIDLIDLVQEWLGAGLSIGSLSREERRALLMVGPSRTGKTELAKIFALLFGGPIATPSVAAISDDRDRFALSSLYGAAAWIRDDAINEGDKLNPQRFKTIVTGEPIDVEAKHRDIVRNYRFELPVCLTCNSLPRAIDGSDAIFNRSIILRMENVVEEEIAAKVRIENAVRPGGSIGTAIFEAEAAGILNWALVGLARLRARGFYKLPDSVRDAISRFRDDNNPIGEWVREAILVDPHSMVERRDLVRSFNGWQFEQEGEKAEGRGARWLLPKLRNQVSGLGDFKGHSSRYVTGLRLTELGLAMWKTYGDANPHGGAGGSASVITDINKVQGKAPSHARGAGDDIPF